MDRNQEEEKLPDGWWSPEQWKAWGETPSKPEPPKAPALPQAQPPVRNDASWFFSARWENSDTLYEIINDNLIQHGEHILSKSHGHALRQIAFAQMNAHQLHYLVIQASILIRPDGSLVLIGMGESVKNKKRGPNVELHQTLFTPEECQKHRKCSKENLKPSQQPSTTPSLQGRSAPIKMVGKPQGQPKKEGKPGIPYAPQRKSIFKQRRNL